MAVPAPAPADSRSHLLADAKLDGPSPDSAFDALARLAARAVGAPIGLVTVFPEAQGQVFKGAWGLPADAPRVHAERTTYCADVLDRGTPWSVRDTRTDATCRAHPARAAFPGVRAYIGVPFFDPAHRPMGVVAVATDQPCDWTNDDIEMLEATARAVEAEVTSRLQSIRVLTRESGQEALQRFYESVMDQMGIECAVWDHALRYVYVSPMAVANAETRTWMLGRTNREYAERRGFPPAIAEMREKLIQGVFDSHVMHSHSERLVDRAGRPRYFRRIYAPVRDASGIVTHVVGSSIDLTAAHLAQQAAQDTAARYRMLTDSSGDLISHHTPDGTYTYASPASRLVLGVEPQRLIGTRPSDWVHREDRERLESFHQSLLLDGSSPSTITARFPHADGRWVWLEAVARVVEPTAGGPREVVSVVRDVTQRIAYQEALVEAREKAEVARAEAEELARLKTSFVANMSHEIRTPLTAVIGFAQVLGEELDPAYHDLVEPIIAGGRRLSETLNSVLDLAHLEAGTFGLHARPVDLAERVTATLALFADMAASRNVTLRFEPPTGLVPCVLADAAAVDRVITNLISNAVKFTPDGIVTVCCEAAHDTVLLTVQDTGVGMDSGFLPHLFSEFRQESTGDAREHEGNGLGLSIVKRLVHAMNGDITVVSKRGRGTAFTVRLPAAPVEERPHRLLTSHQAV